MHRSGKVSGAEVLKELSVSKSSNKKLIGRYRKKASKKENKQARKCDNGTTQTFLQAKNTFFFRYRTLLWLRCLISPEFTKILPVLQPEQSSHLLQEASIT